MSEPIRGRVMRPDEPLPGGLAEPEYTVGPDPEPSAEAPQDRPAPPPDVYEIHVHLPAGGADLSTIEAAPARRWLPAYPLRTAIVSAAGLLPLPSIGAPAGRWALQLGEIAGEQSAGAAWTIGGAAVVGAFAVDRSRRRWDPDERGWRPGWLARALLCAAISGACLALPVFDVVVALITGVTP